MNLHDQRKNYNKSELLEGTIKDNPFEQFEMWFADAKSSAVNEANAMVLATATSDGYPSARIVLLKEVTVKGFVFYTNYDSRKGKEIEQNPYAQILFFWDVLERQVRIEGKLEKVPAEMSEEYFNARPLDSRYGAIASAQSSEISSREYLEQKLKEAKLQEAKRPEDWGGYILVPSYFEFWQGRPSRLHDRIYYQAQPSGEWKTGRLSP